MNPPKIISVQALDDYLLMIEFSNHEYRRYNVKQKRNVRALKKSCFFKNVQIETGGYAVSWNEGIDISEYELWINGNSVD